MFRSSLGLFGKRKRLTYPRKAHRTALDTCGMQTPKFCFLTICVEFLSISIKTFRVEVYLLVADSNNICGCGRRKMTTCGWVLTHMPSGDGHSGVDNLQTALLQS